MRIITSIDALFPATRQMILAATFMEPDRWFYMRELARQLRVPSSSLQRELDSLVRGGILRQKREGRQVYFQAAKDSPIFQDIRGIFLKTVGLADVLRRCLKPCADRIKWAFIFGSIAASREHSASDVDLMIIGELGLSEISALLRPVEQKLNRPVNPSVYTVDQFATKVKSRHHFISTVMRSKKLFVVGDTREFESTFGK